jgi:hypothetical protein
MLSVPVLERTDNFDSGSGVFGSQEGRLSVEFIKSLMHVERDGQFKYCFYINTKCGFCIMRFGVCTSPGMHVKPWLRSADAARAADYARRTAAAALKM